MSGAVLQPMAEPGVETIVGIVRDDLFGSVVMFGLGGTAAELFADRAFQIVPMTDVDAAELVRAPKSAPCSPATGAVRRSTSLPSRTCCCGWGRWPSRCPRSPSSTSTR